MNQTENKISIRAGKRFNKLDYAFTGTMGFVAIILNVDLYMQKFQPAIIRIIVENRSAPSTTIISQ